MAVVLRLNSSVEQLDQRSMQNKGEAFKDVHSSVASESCLVCQIMSMFSDAVVKLEFVTKDAASDDTMMTERRFEGNTQSLRSVLLTAFVLSNDSFSITPCQSWRSTCRLFSLQ